MDEQGAGRGGGPREGDAGDSERTGSALFHAALAAGVVPLLGLPIVLLCAASARRVAGGARWARRVAGLLAIDVALALVVIAMGAGLLGDPGGALSAPRSAARIGVVIDEAYEGDGVRVASVVPGTPADDAGVMAGDVIASVDGAAVGDAAALRRAIDEAPGAVSIELRREGEPRALAIQPTRSAAMVGDRCGEVREGALRPGRGTLVSYGVLVLGALVMGVLGCRRGVPGGARVWPAFVTIPAIGAVAGTGAAIVACDVGARALVLESALVGSEIVLVVLAGSAVWIAGRAARGPEPLLGPGPPLSVPKTVGLGAFYVATWVPRVLVLLTPLLLAAREAGLEGASEALGAVLGGDRTPLALAMTFVAGAVLAPIGEELLFRGLLLPHLARIVAPWAAIAISALLFGALHEAHGVARIGPMTIGAILGWARLRSGTLRAPIALHTIVNASALSVAWLTGA